MSTHLIFGSRALAGRVYGDSLPGSIRIFSTLQGWEFILFSFDKTKKRKTDLKILTKIQMSIKVYNQTFFFFKMMLC